MAQSPLITYQTIADLCDHVHKPSVGACTTCPTCGESNIKKFDGHYCRACNTWTSEGFRSQFPLREEGKEKDRNLHATSVLIYAEKHPRVLDTDKA